jgi:lysophospholipase L1-like esterase
MNNLSLGGGGATLAVQSQITGPIIGSVAKGNRLLVIGDSILAGTASRYGGAMCKQVVQMGWRVAVEAEAGQAADFGRDVLKARLAEGWDAAVVLLGTNPSGSLAAFTRDFTAIITSLAPRPVLVLTTSLYKPRQAGVNTAIRSIASANTNVTLMDWATISATPNILNSDGIHPTDTGRAVLVAAIGQALGPAPTTPGKCLESKFIDDALNESVMGTTTSSPNAVAVSTSVAPTTSTTTK